MLVCLCAAEWRRACRWADCEAYRTSNSDLRLLRQLLLEDGFWCIKDEADALYREQRKLAASSAAAAMVAPLQLSRVGDNDLENSQERTAELEGSRAEAGDGSVEMPAGEWRQSGRGSGRGLLKAPAWLIPAEPAPKAWYPQYVLLHLHIVAASFITAIRLSACMQPTCRHMCYVQGCICRQHSRPQCIRWSLGRPPSGRWCQLRGLAQPLALQAAQEPRNPTSPLMRHRVAAVTRKSRRLFSASPQRTLSSTLSAGPPLACRHSQCSPATTTRTLKPQLAPSLAQSRTPWHHPQRSLLLLLVHLPQQQQRASAQTPLMRAHVSRPLCMMCSAACPATTGSLSSSMEVTSSCACALGTLKGAPSLLRSVTQPPQGVHLSPFPVPVSLSLTSSTCFASPVRLCWQESAVKLFQHSLPNGSV